jgi:hypothetical protein
MQSAAVYFYKGNVYIQASSKTTAGVWVASGPVYKVGKENEELLGIKVLEALQNSKLNVPHPTDFKGILVPLLSEVNVKSYNTFAKNALYIGVEKAQGLIKITPTENLGSKGGFQTISEKSETLKDYKPKELGQTLLIAVHHCK